MPSDIHAASCHSIGHVNNRVRPHSSASNAFGNAANGCRVRHRISVARPTWIASQLGTALAQFHDATASLGRRIDRSALAIDSRLHRMQTLDQIWNQRSFVPLVAGVDAKLQWAVSILQQQWRRHATNAKAALNQVQQLAWPQQYVFRDVHCQNTLFCHSQLTAILDFDALRVDTPATDVARLIGSMQLGMTDDLWFGDAANTSQAVGIGYREKAWKSLLAAYRQIRAFSEEEERLARVLVDVSPLVNLANWVTWLTHEPERFQDRKDEAITRMCEWARVVLGDCSHRGPS
jgi:Ser/Thr protein kinase RdoA (MazF antagonist)